MLKNRLKDWHNRSFNCQIELHAVILYLSITRSSW